MTGTAQVCTDVVVGGSTNSGLAVGTEFGFNQDGGQSFTATCTGQLVAIEVEIFPRGAATGTLRIFEGNPATGTEITAAATPFTLPASGSYRVELTVPVAVTANQTYSFLFDSDAGSPIGALKLLRGFDLGSDPYAGGSAYQAFPGNPPQPRADDDLIFTADLEPLANTPPIVDQPIQDLELPVGVEGNIELANVFSDPDEDPLTRTAESDNPGAATVSLQGTTLLVNAVGVGTTNITVTAADGRGGSVQDVFLVTVTLPQADLEIDQLSLFNPPISKPPFDIGDTFDVLVIVRNGGPDDPGGVGPARLTITAPPGLGFLQTTSLGKNPASCSINAATEVVCSWISFPGFTISEVILQTQALAAGLHPVDAAVQHSGTDTDSGNDAQTLPIPVNGAAPTTGAVSGFKWHDANTNGILDAGEQKLQGWKIEVVQGSQIVADATTGADGSYFIDNLAAGTYTVQESMDGQAGWVQTFPDPNGPNGGTHPVTITAGETTENVNFGNREQAANLSVEKIAPQEVILGDTITYTVIISNAGPDDAHNIRVDDNLSTESLMVLEATLPAGCDLNVVDGAPFAELVCQIAMLRTGQSVELQYQAETRKTGQVTNLVIIQSADEADPTLNDREAQATTLVRERNVDLSVEKTASASDVLVGDTISYVVVVTNDGTDEAAQVDLLDRVAAAPVEVVAASLPSGCQVVGTGALATLSCSLGPLAAGNSVAVHYKIVAKQAGVVVNNVTVGFGGSDGNLENNEDSTTTTVHERSPRLSIEKLALDANGLPLLGSLGVPLVFVDEPFLYEITVTNDGTAEATGVIVTDVLEASLELVEIVSPKNNCSTIGNDLVTCTFSSLQSGDSATITLKVRAKAVAEQICNTASATSNENVEETSAEPVCVEAQIVQQGSIFGVKFHDRNANGVRDADEEALTNPQFTIQLFDGQGNLLETMLTSAVDGMYRFEALDAGTYTVVEVPQPGWRATLPAGGTHTVTVEAGKESEASFGNARHTEFLEQQLEVLPEMNVGEQATLSATITNTCPTPGGEDQQQGDDCTLNVGQTVTIPIDFTIGSGQCWTLDGDGAPLGSCPFTVNENEVTCGSSWLEEGQHQRCEIPVTPIIPGPVIVEGCTYDEAGAGSCTEAPTTILSQDLPALAITKSIPQGVLAQAPVPFDAPIPFMITVTNTSTTETAGDVVVTDVLNALPGSFSASAAEAMPSQGTCTLPQPGDWMTAVTCSLGSLAPGGSATIELKIVLKQGFEGNIYCNTASVEGTFSGGKATASSQPETCITVRSRQATLSITKAALDESGSLLVEGVFGSLPGVFVGEPFLYEITVKNAGPDAATGVIVTDILNAPLELVEIVSPKNKCSMLGDNIVECTFASLGKDESATITLKVRAKAVAEQICNTASATSNENVEETSAEPVCVEARVRNAPLSITKTVSDPDGEVIVGEEFSYTITVTNGGPDEARDVQVRDLLDARLELVEATPQKGMCSIDGNSLILCDLGTLPPGSATVTLKVQASEVAENICNTASVLSQSGSAEVEEQICINSGTQAQQGSISGGKFHDLDGEGDFDSGEVMLPGWTIVLEDAGGNELARAVTNANGTYAFDRLAPGTYRVREIQKEGWGQTFPINNGGVHHIELGQGEQRDGVLFGNQDQRVSTGRIRGIKFHDVNANGRQDTGEEPLPEWIFYLDENKNGGRDAGEESIETGFDGRFEFPELPPGSYVVREELQPGWFPTTPPEGVQTVNLEAGGDVNLLFGNYLSATIEGEIWRDDNENDRRDVGEPTLTGVKDFYVHLTRRDGTGRSVDVDPASGRYIFENVKPGRYTVELGHQSLTGEIWRITTPLDIIGRTAREEMVSSGEQAIVNFGAVAGARIEATSIPESEQDGILDSLIPFRRKFRLFGPEGLSATVFLDDNDNGVLDPGERSSRAESSPFGASTFFTVQAGRRYIIRAVAPSGYAVVEPSEGKYVKTLAPNETFKAPFVFAETDPPREVDSAADSGPGSLREAIEQVNGIASGKNMGNDEPVVLVLNPPGGVITLTTPLPPVDRRVTILSAGISARHEGPDRITLDGSACPSPCDGLTLRSTGSIVEGLHLTGFPGYGLVFGGDGLHLVVRNDITDNASGGLHISGGTENQVGLFVPPGDTLAALFGLAPGTLAADGNRITGNGGPGILIVGESGHTIRGNAIFGNDGPPIAFSDTPPLAPPQLTRVESGTSTRVEGTLGGMPDSLYVVEFFATAACRADGLGEGAAFIAAEEILLDGSGYAAFSVTLDTAFTPRQFITATATGPDGSTSAFSACGSGVPTGVEQAPEGEVTAAFALHPNYPNPFNPRTMIGFELPEAVHVRLTVYDMLGREVVRLIDGPLPAGHHRATFEADDLVSGVYIYRIEAGDHTQTRRMLLVK